MRILRFNTKSEEEIWVAIGGFDGLHIAHKRLIERVRSFGKRSGIVSFIPYPLVFFHPSFNFLLTDYEEKVELLSKSNIDEVFFLSFRDIKDMDPATFLSYLKSNIQGLKGLVVGKNFRFGNAQKGDTYTLKEICKENNIDVVVEEAVVFEGHTVSSTLIRELLLLGRVEKANQLLGRYYKLKGRKVKGHGFGSKLIFPTINVVSLSCAKLIPHDGVYAVWVKDEKGNISRAVMNIGVCPTFKNKSFSMEVYLLDKFSPVARIFDIFFVSLIRFEKRFETPQSLKAQIEQDIKKAEAILEKSTF